MVSPYYRLELVAPNFKEKERNIQKLPNRVISP